MKKGAKIALALGGVALVGGAIFFANEANVFPRSSRPVRSFERAEKIWSAGDYVCARVGGDARGLRCATLGIGRDPVENAISVPFLSDPSAMVEDPPNVCALERGEIVCWNMATPILSGLGLVYSPEQQRAGTIDHGAIPERLAFRLPMKGTVRSLVSVQSNFCALDDEGISCFKRGSLTTRTPEKRWQEKARTMFVAGELVCTDDGDTVQCFADPAQYTTSPVPNAPPFALKVRATGATGITAIAASYWSFCVLGAGGLSCAKRAKGGAPEVEELRLTKVEGVGAPTKIWGAGFDVMVLDGNRILKLDGREGTGVQGWGTLGEGEEIYTYPRSSDWFIYRSGNMVRSPNYPWPIKYSVGGRPSQVVRLGLDTCVLVDGQTKCFGF